MNELPKILVDNLNAITPPTIHDDITKGYSVGSKWIDTSLDKIYFCVANDKNGAIWQLVNNSSSLDSHIADNSNPHDVLASQIDMLDTGEYYTETNIEGALLEIASGVTLSGMYFTDSINVTHNSVSGLQGGETNEFYHLSSAQYGYLDDENAQLGNLHTDGSPTFSTVNATTFDTNVATAGVTLVGTSLIADGTDENINITITPKGSGILSVLADTDGIAKIGRVAVGYNGSFSDYACIGHVDYMTGGGFAVTQDTGGTTIVRSGGEVYFQAGGANTIASIATTGFNPGSDDTFYIGKNDDDTPLAWKGVILKDQTTGTYYRLQIDEGAVNLIDLTD